MSSGNDKIHVYSGTGRILSGLESVILGIIAWHYGAKYMNPAVGFVLFAITFGLYHVLYSLNIGHKILMTISAFYWAYIAVDTSRSYHQDIVTTSVIAVVVFLISIGCHISAKEYNDVVVHH